MRPVVIILVAVVARLASADPALGRVLTAPTAWLPAAGEVVGAAGIDHRGQTSFGAEVGLGDLAAVELDRDSDIRACDSCTTPSPIGLERAGFRIGARQDAWFAGQPAIVLGTRVTFGGGGRVSEMYGAASRVVGPLRLHVGLGLLAARVDDLRMGAHARPSAGVELVPPQFPRTTMLADLAWVPRLDHVTGPTLESLAGFGVRYQAFAWGAVELAVRRRGGEGLADSTVLVRAIIEIR